MYKRLSSVLFPVVMLALIGAVFWGYQVNQEKNAILIKAENQYQRAFHDLSYHVDQLNKELGNALAVNATSQQFHRKCLVNSWRITSQAQNEINQLPLSLLPFNKTEEFLANMANFSYRTAVRDLSKEPMTPDEVKTLKVLYEKSKEISGDLRDVQSKVIANNLRWMDVEVALASHNENMDNTIIDGFKTVDKKVSAYPEINWGPSMASVYQKHNVQALGRDVSIEEIKQKAARFLGMNPANAQVVENGTGTKYGSYSIAVQKSQNQSDIQMDFSKKGGNLLWFMKRRDVPESKLSADQAGQHAQQFLNSHGYANMVPINYDEYQHVATIIFAAKQGDVIVFPEKLTVQVALDNGEIIGMQATDYVYEHKQRQIPTPALNAEQAKQKLNPEFKVNGQNLALIKNDGGQEVLCYQFIGRINGSHYRIYIDAAKGTEEKVEVVRDESAQI